MPLSRNGVFVVQGEMSMLVTAMRRSTRWGSHSFLNEEYDVLMRTFEDLKSILNQIDDLRSLDPLTYLSPFLEVVRSKETTGPVTSLALSAINKFISYGLIDITHPNVPATVEDIADAVTHARFVGTDHSSDGVVLMKILQVLRTLMLSPEGAMLTDESVCEIMLSCFRICFETRLTEILRRHADQCLRDMTQLIFMRLPDFPPEDIHAKYSSAGLSLKKKDKVKRKSITSSNTTTLERSTSTTDRTTSTDAKTDTPVNRPEKESGNPDASIDGMKLKKHNRHSSMDLATDGNTSITQLLEKCVGGGKESEDIVPTQLDHNKETKSDEPNEVEKETEVPPPGIEPEETQTQVKDENGENLEEYVNNRGIRFTQQTEKVNLQPYGLVCVRELFRFLISLCNPLEEQNTSAMVHLGLSLLITAFDVSAPLISQNNSLLALVKDSLCRNLISLLSTERITIFALDLQVSFLIFESLRRHLKYQLECFLKKIIEIISTDTTNSAYEIKEIQHLSLEYLAQLYRVPNMCTELYINYDCDVYCVDVFEETAKVLSRNLVSSSAYNVHRLSLEALMTMVEAIEGTEDELKPHCEPISEVQDSKYGRSGHITLDLDDGPTEESNPHTLPKDIEHIRNIKNLKKVITKGTEIFNTHPEKGIDYLIKNGALSDPLDPKQVASFLRECPNLDKKMIGDYICKRSSRGEDDGPSVLSSFANSFDFANLRIDQALRLYLETFRLPGEAPLIFLVLERFSEQWHSSNGNPFENIDAAFRLAYAVIMLNMDQHNHNAKKLNVPMTVEDFVKNLRGCNGNGDYDQPMLEAIYYSIKESEMIMPAERTGAVKDAYLWRVLQRRSVDSVFSTDARPLQRSLFQVVAMPAITALSSAFERAQPPTAEELNEMSERSLAIYSLNGIDRCASLTRSDLFSMDGDQLTIDTILLTLCKFTGLMGQTNPIVIGVTLGQSPKSQLSLLRASALFARHGDGVREAWKHFVVIVKALFIGRLLPKCLVEAEDYIAPNGTVSLIRDSSRSNDAGILSSLYSYIAQRETGLRAPTPHEKALIEIASQCVNNCNLPNLLIAETKFLPVESLHELLKALLAAGAPPDHESLQLNPELEDVTIFFLEVIGQCVVQNRDRISSAWPLISEHLSVLIHWACSQSHSPFALRRVVSLLLRTTAKAMRSDHCSHQVLHKLNVLFHLPHKLFYQMADIISCGLYELVKTSAQNIHSAEQWQTVLKLMCACGAGSWPKENAVSAASSRSEGSSDESERKTTVVSSDSEKPHSPTHDWILVPMSRSRRVVRALCMRRVSEAMALLVRDVAHVTPHNASHVVHALRTLSRTALHEGKKHNSSKRSGSSHSRSYDEESSSEEENSQDEYHMISLQLLDLMHTLHSRTAQIFKWWKDEAEQGQGEEYDLWEVAWKPLLQGIALFCTDRRKQVANSAIAYLQRGLLVPGLSSMSASNWQSCFEQVLFPLMYKLSDTHETASRANTIMCKVFLQHMSSLSSRAEFPLLWCRVISIQRSLVQSQREPVTESALESLKNAVLVMHSVKIFNDGDNYNDLWQLTWEKIGEFLPNLKEELFPEEKPQPSETLPVPLTSNQDTTDVHQSASPLAQSPSGPLAHGPIGPSGPLAHEPIIPKPFTAFVPIREAQHTQGALSSSVLLQPLNEMKSTPIGMSINQLPILYPSIVSQSEEKKESTVLLQPQYEGEIYSEYINDPYVEKLNNKEATLYEPGTLKEKSVSETNSPVRVSRNFGSSDNLVNQVFNYSNYFGGPVMERSDFDNLCTDNV